MFVFFNFLKFIYDVTYLLARVSVGFSFESHWYSSTCKFMFQAKFVKISAIISSNVFFFSSHALYSQNSDDMNI